MKKDILQLKNQAPFKNSTLLGVGPMSLNCVNASIEIANENQVPVLLIASRRQIDSEQFGGGYVNNWTTETFCKYVTPKNNKGYIFLARDHGGPWQSEKETAAQMNLEQAMQSAKDSYRADIQSGINIIHLDPSKSLTGYASIPEYIERTKELILFCNQTAQELGKDISIEVGTDEGVVGQANFAETKSILMEILDFCQENNIPRPNFMVVQTGTKVMEMQNVGILDNLINMELAQNHTSELEKLIELCANEGLLLKEHNADYLSNQTLKWHPQIGINSANIAPEFGVVETKAFLNILNKMNLDKLSERFLELAFSSGKWQKWMLENTQATDYERSIIAGHYVFSTEEFQQIKQEAQLECDFDIDLILKNAVKDTILNCVTQFGLVKQNKPVLA